MRSSLTPQNVSKMDKLWKISHPLKEVRWKGPGTMDSGMSRIQLSIGWA